VYVCGFEYMLLRTSFRLQLQNSADKGRLETYFINSLIVD